MPKGAVELRNGLGDIGYGGPFLLPGAGLHEYHITVYALKEEVIELGPLVTRADVMLDIDGRVIDSARTLGLLRT